MKQTQGPIRVVQLCHSLSSGYIGMPMLTFPFTADEKLHLF